LRPIYLISKTPYPGVHHIPVLSIRFLTPSIDFSKFDGIIFTSKQGIEAAKRYDIDWSKLQCVSVSEPTAKFAKKAGAVHVIAGDGYGETIPSLLQAAGLSTRWLYLRPETVASTWADTARASGLNVDEAVVYETVCNPDAANVSIETDAVLIFTSPSSIRCFLQNYSLLKSHTVVAIGTTTLNALPSDIEGQISVHTSVESAVELARTLAQSDEK
jgi:uroporphyrinogen-III synthase